METNSTEQSAWEQLAPFLDEAMAKLGAKDRDAVLLRYFENKTLAEVGRALGTGEDSARMRVNRALEKLRVILTRRGAVLSGVAVAGLLSANAVQAAPAGLGLSVGGVAVKGVGAAASVVAAAKATLKAMRWFRLKLAVGAGLTVAAGGAMVFLMAGMKHAPFPVALVRGLEMARLKIPPSRLHLHVAFRSPSRTNESDQVMEFDGGKRRSLNQAPKGMEAASVCYDGSQVCLYLPSRKQASLRDIRDDTPDPLFDPRTLGLSSGLGWGASPSDELPYKKGRVDLVGRELIRGVETWHVRISVENPFKYQIHLWVGDTDQFPVYRCDVNINTERQSVESFYDDRSYPWLPSRTECSSFDSKGNLRFGLTVALTKAEANVAFSKRNWTLAGLNMPIGTEVVDRRTKMSVGFWNGTSVTPMGR